MTHPTIQLCPIADTDLPHFFQHQLDPVAVYMAAFTCKDPTDHLAFAAHWARLRADPRITIRTILYGDLVAGHLAAFGPVDEPEITYWIARDLWNRGIATQALSLFLADFQPRPLYARAAKDNLASLRVLEKCGFVPAYSSSFFANARNREVEELVLKLDAR